MQKKAKKPTINVRNNITFAQPQQQPLHPEEQQPVAQSRWKRAFRKVWWFLWQDTSIWSWIANIALAFIIIKFLVYPGLGLVLGTSHPIVAVVSSSMEHDDGFDSWWVASRCAGKSSMGIYATYGITKEEFRAFPFHQGFNKGDLMVLKRARSTSVGDVVVFNANMRDPIIHRAILLANGSVQTLGDNNCQSATFEQNIEQDQLIGKAFLRIPLLGWIKLGFVELIGLVTGR